MKLRSTLGAALVSVLFAAVIPTAVAHPVTDERGPNLVTNGGFEDTDTVTGSGWTASGFIAEGFDFSIDTNSADAHSGDNSFSGGGIGAPGFITQNLATTPGAEYNIHVWLANLSGFSADTAIQIMWGGNLVYSATDILGFGYTEIVIDPTATSASTALAIGLQDDSFFLNVDDISVRQVPEPASLALLLGGLGAAGLARRRRSTT